MVETIAIGVTAIGVVYWTFWEAQKYYAGGDDGDGLLPYSRERFRRRLTVSLVLLTVLGLIQFRGVADRLVLYPSLMLAYYGLCLVLALFLALLALGDLTETSRQLREARKGLIEESVADLTKDFERAKKTKRHKKKK